MKRLILMILLLAGIAGAQQTRLMPDCQIGLDTAVVANVITSPDSIDFDNRNLACTTWQLTYVNDTPATLTAVSLEPQAAPSSGGAVGAYATWVDIPAGTTLPLTAVNNGGATAFKYQPWVRIHVNSATGSGRLRIRMLGWRPFGGQDVNSSAAAGAMVGQYDDAATVLCVENGYCTPRLNANRMLMVAPYVQVSISDNITANVGNPHIDGTLSGLNGRGVGVYEWCYDGSALDGCRATGIGNMNTSQTTTANNVVGGRLFENGGRWVINSAPAAGSQGSASIAAEAATRHVATRVCYSAGSVVAPVLTSKTIVIRDGATGAGVVLMTLNVTISAATGNNVVPNCIDIGNLVGTTNTAMTAEWDAGLANLSETVALEGFNVN